MFRAEIAARGRAGFAALRRAGAPPPRLSRWAWTADAILAVAVSAGTLSGARYPQDYVGSGPPAAGPWHLLLAALTGLPLLVRRRYPLAAFWLVIGASQLYHLWPGFDPTFTYTACLIAGYSAAMYSPYQAAALTSVVVGAGVIVGHHKASVPAIKPGLVTFLILIPLGLLANAIHTWKQRVQTLQAQQAAATQLAVEQERSRIAHDLHDVVTHNVSVMVVQAGAARKVMDTAPEQAREALLAVESGGRAAMSELRHVMGLLTMNGDSPGQLDERELAPQPGLARVPALIARIRESGVPVDLNVTGTAGPLPTGPDLTAYRVVQEALTNTLKHAVGAVVKVTIDHTTDTLLLEVTDSGGTRAPSADTGNGRGLIGLRERLALYGGTLEAGKQPAGGYRVRAVLPVEQP